MRKPVLLLVLSIIVMSAVPVSGCSPSGQAADDVVSTPGGFAYRANVIQQGVRNPWPPIQVTEKALGTAPDLAQITYRENIQTEAGQARNIIFGVYLPGVTDLNSTHMEVKINAVNLPLGMTANQTDYGWGADPARHSQTVVRIFVSHMSGEFSFQFNVEINGKDYGLLPCTFKVTDRRALFP